jgi:hypothetical protein
MNATVQLAIDAELGLLERIVVTPREPFGYGTDVSLASDLSVTLELVDAFGTRGLAEAILRRLDCPRGALVDNADYGIDVRSFCNRGMTKAEIDALAGQVRAEVEKDDRIDRAFVKVTPTPTGDELTIEIIATPADARAGRFTLILAATPAEILLEELRGA